MNDQPRDCDCVIPTVAVPVEQLNLCDNCMRGLTALNLRSTKLSVLPDHVGDLHNLEIMDLSFNRLNKLPMSLSGLERLAKLDLSGNNFTHLPKCLVHGLASLTSLNLSRNHLVNVNDSAPQCLKRLVTLNIGYNTRLTAFPKWLWSADCVALESLNISFTSCLDNVELVNNFHNQGIANCLVNLDISNTNAKARKLDFIHHLKNIKSVDMGNQYGGQIVKNNRFKRLPEVFNYEHKSVTKLSMTNVKLTSFEKNDYFNILNIKNLNLSCNTIVLLPNSIGQLSSLEVCDLSKNKIIAIPESFRNLKNLKSLVLNNNQLKSFPNILNDLVNLKSLDLYANKLTESPSWKINLNSIDLEQNLFPTEQAEITGYPSMLWKLRSAVYQIRLDGPVKIGNLNNENTSRTIVEPNFIGLPLRYSTSKERDAAPIPEPVILGEPSERDDGHTGYTSDYRPSLLSEFMDMEPCASYDPFEE